MADLLVNRYFASRYTAADALTAYIYCISVERLVYVISYARILEYVSSLVPDSEMYQFDKFATDKRENIETKRYRYMCENLGKEFTAWDADDKRTAEMDRHGLRTAFHDLLLALDDNGICCLLMKMDRPAICYFLLGCDEQMRWYVMRLFGESQRTEVMEELMDIPFAADETLEKCMETMGRTIKTGIFHLRTGTVLKGLGKKNRYFASGYMEANALTAYILLKVMDDNVAASLFGNMCDTDICYSLMGADESLRKHMMGLLDGRHRLRLMEHWMDIKFNAEALEKCMEAMGKVMRKGIRHLCMETAEKSE